MVRFRIESNCFILHTFLGYIYIPGTYLDKDSLGGAENSNHNAMIGMRCACMRNHWWLHLHIIWASNASFCCVFCHAQAKVEGKTHVVKHTYSSENHGFLNWLKGKVMFPTIRFWGVSKTKTITVDEAETWSFGRFLHNCLWDFTIQSTKLCFLR